MKGKKKPPPAQARVTYPWNMCSLGGQVFMAKFIGHMWNCQEAC